MGFASLRFSVADGIGRITLARPERGNPFDDVFARELRQVAEPARLATKSAPF